MKRKLAFMTALAMTASLMMPFTVSAAPPANGTSGKLYEGDTISNGTTGDGLSGATLPTYTPVQITAWDDSWTAENFFAKNGAAVLSTDKLPSTITPLKENTYHLIIYSTGNDGDLKFAVYNREGALDNTDVTEPPSELKTALEFQDNILCYFTDPNTITGAGTHDTNVTYKVDQVFTVTIPAKVELGKTATISASDLNLETGNTLNVTLTGTSETDNTFKLKTAAGDTITYTITENNADGDEVGIDDAVLTVTDTEDEGTATLYFNEPTTTPKAGTYTGTVTFTISTETT